LPVALSKFDGVVDIVDLHLGFLLARRGAEEQGNYSVVSDVLHPSAAPAALKVSAECGCCVRPNFDACAVLSVSVLSRCA
jgi:hypothetical protein